MNSRSIIKEVCPTSTLELIKRGYLLLDVRENNEVQELAFEIPGLIHIPLSELEERHLEIPKDEIIIVACHTGERSYRAIEYLREIGLTNLLNMKKGLVKWVQKGFPTKGDTSSIPQHTCCRGFHC
jgi:rhodanese-related sulfurtransferase